MAKRTATTNRATPAIRKVVVAAKLSDASWRDFLTGFFDYAKRKTHWDIRVVQSAMSLEQTAPGCHGIVTGIEPPRGVLSACARDSTPIVAVGADWKMDAGNVAVAYIRNDNEDIGRFCARHFQSLGKFASAGFVPTGDSDDWSAARERGFLSNIRVDDKSTFHSTEEPGSDADIAALADWLKSLPRPTAVMAAWDMRAVHALSACRLARLKVPEQISVIGVDDDRLLCDFSTPPLTSIAPDHALEGQIAAKTLDGMMRRRFARQKSKRILNTAKKIVERESAKPISPATALIARAIAFIEVHASKNIKTADVTEYLSVSRSLLDMRFRELRGETVAQAIASRRLADVKRLLSDTKLSIRAITAKCGFSSPNHLKNMFKRHFGTTMRNYRAVTSPPAMYHSPQP